jgi:hypothetical protein
MGNISNRQNAEIVGDSAKLKKSLVKPQTEQFLIINEDMVLIERSRESKGKCC